MKNRHHRMTTKCSAYLLAACIVMSAASCSKKKKDEEQPQSSIKISNYVGDVSLAENGAASDLKPQTFLSKDNVLTTKENGSVDVQLDDKKMVGLDVNSSAKFTQDGNTNTVELNEGALYFYTTEKLSEGEKFVIEMPSMNIEIRGTSGYIVYNAKTGVAKITLTSGKVHIIGSNPITGGTNEIDMEAGNSAQLCMFDYLEGSDSVRFLMGEVTPNDLPPLLVQKIVENPEVFERVLEETNWDKDKMMQIAESANVVNASVEGSENYAAASIEAQNSEMASLSTIFQTPEQAEEAGAVTVGDSQAVLVSDGDQTADNNEIPVVNPVVDPQPEQPVVDQPVVDEQQENQPDGQEDEKKDSGKKNDKKDSGKTDSSKDKDSKDKDSTKDKDKTVTPDTDKKKTTTGNSSSGNSSSGGSSSSSSSGGKSGGSSSGSTSSGGGGGGGGGGSSSGNSSGGNVEPQPHSISVPTFTGGTITANPSSAKSGTPVTLTIQASTGYKLSALSVTGKTFSESKSGAVSSYSFTMPDEDVSVSATFVQEEYAFSVPESVNGCSVWIVEDESTAETLKSKYFHAGDTVYFGVRLNTGYSLDSISVSSGAQLLQGEESGYSVYSFVMPASNVTASVSTQFNGTTYSVSIEYDDNCVFMKDEDGEVIIPAISSDCKTSYAAGDAVEILIENPTAEILDGSPLYLYNGSLEDEDFWMEVAYELDNETMTMHVLFVMPESDVIIYFAAAPEIFEPVG